MKELKNTLLLDYVEKLQLSELEEKQKSGKEYISWVEAKGRVIDTLWLPYESSNRTATTNLNHEIHPIQVESGFLVGTNYNCGTGYLIIDTPLGFDDSKLDFVKSELAKKLGIEGNATVRLLLAKYADEIREIIYENFSK